MLQDYRLCRELGFRTLRDGLRWHLIEKAPGKYDWSSWMPVLEAAEQAGMQINWDLFHYGSPDHVDQGAADFPDRFTDFALAALELQQSVSKRPPLVCPLNEINFLSWAVDDGYFPHVGSEAAGLVQGPARQDRDHRVAGDQAGVAEGDDRLGRAADPHRTARSAATDACATPAKPSGHVRGL